MLAQFGITGAEAEAYADKLGLIPGNINTAVTLTGAEEAELKLRALKERLDAIPGNTYKRITLESFSVGNKDVSIGEWATGGPVRGPGTSTSDDVPAMLSDGEHVLTAAEVRAAGGHSAIEKYRAALRSGEWRGITSARGIAAKTADSEEYAMELPSGAKRKGSS
ncbi:MULTISPECIES: hypothetical protein [unclassified Microbacterium]|uniref:hypothetical protein n=1 Tax=unclassified Microbacterium TaxID=2609290 RepID=UPI003138C8D9